MRPRCCTKRMWSKWHALCLGMAQNDQPQKVVRLFFFTHWKLVEYVVMVGTCWYVKTRAISHISSFNDLLVPRPVGLVATAKTIGAPWALWGEAYVSARRSSAKEIRSKLSDQVWFLLGIWWSVWMMRHDFHIWRSYFYQMGCRCNSSLSVNLRTTRPKATNGTQVREESRNPRHGEYGAIQQVQDDGAIRCNWATRNIVKTC